MKFNVQSSTSKVAVALVIGFLLGARSSLADVDVSKLPAPAQTQIDFARDIQPIFEGACFRCHGVEKSKAQFSLANRESALRGGENGVDIVPGDSARSPLIHYVARLVPDMEMPPPGKGEPLTLEQISLLRAWIDQGALWSTSAPPPRVTFSVSPTFRWIGVRGDEKKFREVENMRNGSAGGIEEFSFREQIDSTTHFAADGHAIFDDEDFRVNLELRKNEFGFVRVGIQRWRKYYDDTGGFYRPATPVSFDLGRDLHLDSERVWADFGLALPNWPQMVLGYEYDSRQGEKSILQWGDVNGRNIYPSFKTVDERAHILKFDLTHEIAEWRIEDNARVEFYDLRTARFNAASFSLGPHPDSTVRSEENFEHVHGMNTLRVERPITDWLFASAGYLYSKIEGDAGFDQATLDNAGMFTGGSFWFANDIAQHRETHIGSANALISPADGFSISVGLQSEWSQQESFGKTHLDEGDPNFPDSFLLRPTVVDSDLDRRKLSENVLFRFTKVPFTILFAEARFSQEHIAQFESFGDENETSHSLLRDTDATNDRRDWRTGFSTSPWQRVSLNAHFRQRLSDSDYEHLRDAGLDGFPGEGYSAFINGRRIDTDELHAKLVFKALPWLKTAFTYQRVSTDFRTRTDPLSDPELAPGGRIFAGSHDAHIYGVNATLTPIRQLYLSAGITYSDTRTATADNGNASVTPYSGDVWTLISSATFLANKTTDLTASYSYTRANHEQDNFVDGLPLGQNFERHSMSVGVRKRLSADWSTSLRYAFFRYHEIFQRNANDYLAHGIFGTITMNWR